MRLRHADDTALESFVSRKTPTVTDVECAGGTARTGRGAGGSGGMGAGGSGGMAGAKKFAQHAPSNAPPAKKFAQHAPSNAPPAKKFALQAQKGRFWGVLSVQGELFRAHTHHQTTQGERFRAQDELRW